jgi:hypothetical protein
MENPTEEERWARPWRREASELHLVAAGVSTSPMKTEQPWAIESFICDPRLLEKTLWDMQSSSADPPLPSLCTPLSLYCYP